MLPVRPERGQGQTHPRPVADPHSKDLRITDRDIGTNYVHHRAVNSHRKTGPLRSTPYEAHSVAPEKLEGPRVTRKGDTRSKITPPSSQMVAGEKQCASRSTITPTRHALQIFIDASKEGWGAHLNERTARRTKLHINYLEVKAVFLALKEFQDLCENNIVLIDNTTAVAYINKEGGMKSGSLHALLWRILT